ncbi:MAG TPA: diacylglycerol kinase family protein [Ktedonobacterales bacterium]
MGHKHKMVRAMVIYNPRSGKGNADISAALSVLREEGWDVTVCEKRHDGEGTTYAKEAVKRGFDVVVASGGDGTVNETMSGLVGSEVPLGVFPIGTMNLWASQLGYARRPDVVARQLVLGEQRQVDVGHVAVDGAHAGYFLLIAGLGADAAVLSRSSRGLKNRIGSLAEVVAAVEAMRSLEVVPMRAIIDGVPWYGRSGQIVIGNSRRYGGLSSVTGDAYIDDGMLDICIFTVDNLLGVVRQAGSLVLRQMPDPSSAEVYRASSIKIQMLRPLPVEIDGSVVDWHETKTDAKKGHKPTEYTFTVLPLALRVVAPRTYNGELFQPAPLTTSFALGDVVRVASNGHAGAHANARDSHSDNGHVGLHPHSGKSRHRMRVIAVGVDSVIAQHMPDGRTVTLTLNKKTRIEDGHGDALQALGEGDIVQVKGKQDERTGTFKAKRITLLAEPAGRK